MKTTASSIDTDHASSISETSDEARFKRANRRQVEMITLSLNQRLDVDHPVRAVWAFVEGLDLTELYGKIKAVKGKAGAAAIDPRILFALWIYATIRGIGSGRRIAELCDPLQGETAYQWICGGVSVNYHTINDFRTAHPECLDRCLTESVAVLMNEGLVSLDRIAQDGMRVRADASGKSFHREATLETCLADAEEQIRLLRDESSRDSSGSTRREKAAKERDASERKERIRSAIEQIQDVRDKAEKRKKGTGDKARCSTTDPDARRMKMADGGFRPAFNVQFATTADSRVIVGVSVTNCGSDSGLLGPMLDQVEDRFGVRPVEALVDGGFVSSDDMTLAEQKGTTVFAPVKEEQKKRDKGLDPFARVKGDTDEVAAWRARMGTIEAQGIYQARAGIAEFSNAGCRNRGLYQFAVRGLEKVKCETLWQVLAGVFQRGLNLRKLMAEGMIGG
jgi:transposase